MIALSVRADLKGLSKDLTALERTQLPYATALALTATAKAVQAGETAALSEVFDRPTPFTQRAFGVKGATKATLTAVVFAKDIQAEYLSPFAEGSARQQLRGKRGLPVPKNLRPNQYGNLPRGTLGRLRGRKDVFFGAVKTRTGETVSGVWQRPGKRGGLKLLLRWTSGVELHQNLHYRERAAKIVAATFPGAMRAALARAIATIRR
jgi:hypothetical protein